MPKVIEAIFENGIFRPLKKRSSSQKSSAGMDRNPL